MTDLGPGPELDALVAEKVMGWKNITPSDLDGLRYERPDGSVLSMTWTARMGVGCWSPSTDIRAAWEVVERVRGRPWSDKYPQVNPGGRAMQILIDRWDVGGVWLGIGEVDESFVVAHHGIPHAICLAALKAAG